MPEIKTNITSRLHYIKMGSGPALVLLHGFPESHKIWRMVWEQLSQAYTLIMPDFPGSGGSLLEGETSIEQMADCVKEILVNEQIEQAVIAGHSMGGYTAFAFAAKYPELTKGLSIIHSSPAADDDEKKQTRLRSIELIRKGGKSAFIRQMVTNLFPDSFRASDPELIEAQIQSALETDENALVNYYLAMIGRKDQRNWLENASIPIQWILGTEDNLISYKKILVFCIKSGVNFVSLYNGCGHMGMLEFPERLAADLGSFTEYCNGHS